MTESAEQGWERVETLGSETEAALVVGFLQSNGITARVESKFFHQEPVTFGPLAEVRICVASDDLAEARRLLASRRARFDLIDGEGIPEAEEIEDGSDPGLDPEDNLREGRS